MSREKIVFQAESAKTVTENIEDQISQTARENSQTKDGVFVKGMALPFGETSRNGVQYERESVKEASEDLVGRPILFNHKQDFSTGHILNIEVTEDGMYYEGDINPNAEMPNGVTVAEAVERGDIRSPSIQAFIEQTGEEADEDGVVDEMPTEKVKVADFVEISMVTVPGFPNATAMPEHLQRQGVKPVTEIIGTKEENTETESFDDYPKAAQENARMALDARDNPEYDNDECGTQTGFERANQLDNGEKLSEETVGRMVSFFARHEGNEEVDEGDTRQEDCGWLMHKAWGGDEAKTWANSKQDQIEDEYLEDDNMPEQEQSEQEDSAESEKTKSEMNPNEMINSVMDTIDGNSEELKSELREMMETMMDAEEKGDKDEDEDDENEEQVEESEENTEEKDGKSKEELKEKVTELEERLEKLVDSDEGKSKQESPSQEESGSTINKRPSFKGLRDN